MEKELRIIIKKETEHGMYPIKLKYLLNSVVVSRYCEMEDIDTFRAFGQDLEIPAAEVNCSFPEFITNMTKRGIRVVVEDWNNMTLQEYN